MQELWLKFTDPDGDERRVQVDSSGFAIGRHSENVLCISDSRLSRHHAVIERSGDEFVISDVGSSNGTEVNGEKLTSATPLRPGDRLSLGGFEVDLEFEESENEEPAEAVAAAQEPAESEAPGTTLSAPQSTAHQEGGFPKIFFIIGPIFALLILSIVGVVIYVSAEKSSSSGNSNFVYSGDSDEPSRNRRSRNTSSGNSDDPANVSIPSNTQVSNTQPANSATNTDGPSSDTGKTERNAAAFLRHAAQNDAKAFITGQQAKIVNDRIKSLAASSALADNISSTRKSSAQIKSLAASKNLKPQFLAVAAMAKLGSSRGDVLQTAQSMAETLSKLETQVGTELGEDCLLMMAAYDQGAAGDLMKMRNMLQDLASKAPESSRVIRTVWYLKQNGKISDAQFELALRFLAIGTITQNPKDYGVNAEALVF